MGIGISSVDKQHNTPRTEKLLFFLMFLPCVMALNRGLDNDIWFLLNSGRYVLSNGIPYVEPFTIHNNLAFVMQQWLSNVIFWLTYSFAGYIGLKVLLMCFYILVVFLMFTLCMKVSEENFFISFTVSITFCTFISMFMTHRPIIFTLSIVLLELYALESFTRLKCLKSLIILPFLSILQINLHAAMWPIIFIMFLPYLVDSVRFRLGPFSNQGYKKGSFVFVIIVMVAAGIINPYGVEAMSYLYKSYGHLEISNFVYEMKPPSINSFLGFMCFFELFLVLSVYLFYRKGQTRLRYFLITAGTAYMALSSIRNFSLFTVCGFFPLAYYLQDVDFPIVNNTSERTVFIRKMSIAMFSLAVLVLFFATFSSLTSKDIGNPEFNDLIHVVEYVLKHDDSKEVRLYVGYNDGGLTEFRGLSSYIDPRAEVFVKENNKKADIMLEYFEMQAGMRYYKEVLEKYDFTHLIAARSDILFTYLMYDNDYKLVYSNDSYRLFEKINVL